MSNEQKNEVTEEAKEARQLTEEELEMVNGGVAGLAHGVMHDIRGIDCLNPNKIESIDVLKDASATAIFGARGAN